VVERPLPIPEPAPVMFALKLFLVPSLIGAITLASRRWGPGVAGWLSGFPIVSAPVLFFFAVDQGPQFASDAAVATLSAVFAVFLFSLAYAWTATRADWHASLAAGMLGYFSLVGLLSLIGPPVWVSAPLIVVMVAAAPRLFPPGGAPREGQAGGMADLALRMIAGAALVVALTWFASDLGPRLSGLFAMFPVLGTVLAVFSHRHSGAPFTITLLRGMTLGYYAFSTFCLVLALALPRLSVALAFMLALGSAALIQILARQQLRRV
jgi:hypothetical protein